MTGLHRKLMLVCGTVLLSGAHLWAQGVGFTGGGLGGGAGPALPTGGITGGGGGGFGGGGGGAGGGFGGQQGGGNTSTFGSAQGGLLSTFGSVQGGQATGASVNQPGSTGTLGRFYGNPIVAGLANATGSEATRFIRPYPAVLSFGQPAYGTGIFTQTSGTARAAVQVGGLPAYGATSAGVRRAPQYITEPVFDIAPRLSLETRRGDLQSVIQRSSRLPSRDNIQVVTEGDTVVLRGQVRDERERRLAEAVIRLSPGVTLVRNELRANQRSKSNNKP